VELVALVAFVGPAVDIGTALVDLGDTVPVGWEETVLVGLGLPVVLADSVALVD